MCRFPTKPPCKPPTFGLFPQVVSLGDYRMKQPREVDMSEKQTVKPRTCLACGTSIDATAAEIKQHEHECRAAAATLGKDQQP